MKVAVLVPATSNRRNWKDFKHTDLYTNLFRSFFTTYNKNHTYTFFLGIDEDDKLYNDIDVIKEITQFINSMRGAEIHITKFGYEYKGKPCHIWNKLYEISLQCNNDYYLQVGSDIEFMDCNWCECMIEKLKENNDIGVVGLSDAGRRQFNPTDSLLTQTMVSKKHYDIFSFYFPPELISWFSDNWIGDIYELYERKFIVNQRIINCGGDPRYDVPQDCKIQYNNCINKYFKYLYKYKLDGNNGFI